jgi:hypothetical protein
MPVKPSSFSNFLRSYVCSFLPIFNGRTLRTHHLKHSSSPFCELITAYLSAIQSTSQCCYSMVFISKKMTSRKFHPLPFLWRHWSFYRCAPGQHHILQRDLTIWFWQNTLKEQCFCLESIWVFFWIIIYISFQLQMGISCFLQAYQSMLFFLQISIMVLHRTPSPKPNILNLSVKPLSVLSEWIISASPLNLPLFLFLINRLIKWIFFSFLIVSSLQDSLSLQVSWS